MSHTLFPCFIIKDLVFFITPSLRCAAFNGIHGGGGFSVRERNWAKMKKSYQPKSRMDVRLTVIQVGMEGGRMHSLAYLGVP
jgi:hypothetical protein